jgi:uncharacterized metal-binding protein
MTDEAADEIRERRSARRRDKPLVYSCSGCSSAAQMANWIALQLDRSGRAEMSCIAGVGGDVPSLVRVATSGRPVIALDGCVLACTRNSLSRHEVEPAVHVLLSDAGVRKRKGVDFEPEQAATVLTQVRATIDAALPAPAVDSKQE